MTNDDLNDAPSLEDARTYVRALLREGYRAAAECTEIATESLSDELGETTAAALVPRIVDEESRALASAMLEWPSITDCDRLDAAFEDLEVRGIVARQNFSCCSNCGEAEIGAEIDSAEAEGRAVRGYTFFHMQDVERAVAGGVLRLKYGPSPYDEAAVVGIGREIQETLIRHGLRSPWNGSADECVAVELDWKRRPPGE
ncbi:MAG TPA: hypothetical protein VLT33_35900 [Labilithrix sp.]|nr:hypothetical protein [Labilithrix sp.]